MLTNVSIRRSYIGCDAQTAITAINYYSNIRVTHSVYKYFIIMQCADASATVLQNLV